MTWQQIFTEIELQSPTLLQRVKKQVWNEQKTQFLPVEFVRIFTLTSGDRSEACEWHRTNYGEPRYLGAWWHDDRSIWLREDLATFWLLKTGSHQ